MSDLNRFYFCFRQDFHLAGFFHRINVQMSTCPCPNAFCDWEGRKLGTHFQHSPSCRPAVTEPPPAKRVRPFQTAERYFQDELNGVMQTSMMSAHFNMFMNIDHLERVMEMMSTLVKCVVDFVDEESKMTDVRRACTIARSSMLKVPSVEAMIAKGRRAFLRVEPLVFANVPGSSSGACFFSIIQLITALLQESKAVRQQTIAASEDWKRGDMYGTLPDTYDDLTSGSAFRSNQSMCGAAKEEEKKDLRIVIHLWTDEFTSVDGLGVNAKEHKYGVVLAALVNLPKRMRHYVDHVLMVALYQSKFSKRLGGLVRMLTGTDNEGGVHADGCTLASELEASQKKGIAIQLPNDEKTGGTRTWLLRVTVLLISVDWLAAGEFGPFAGSVSARHPCGKCMWTQDCPCAFRAAGDASEMPATEHSECCRRDAPRTHAGVMETVKEMRAWKGTKKLLEEKRTDTGIFSTHFASEHLLQDIVRDPSLDIMHLAFCGMSRYLLSWLLDILIPYVFSWDALNERRERHKSAPPRPLTRASPSHAPD